MAGKLDPEEARYISLAVEIVTRALDGEIHAGIDAVAAQEPANVIYALGILTASILDMFPSAVRDVILQQAALAAARSRED